VNKLVLSLLVLILTASMLSIIPVESYDFDFFTLIKAYWGTNQEIQVSPGDVATLTVILRYETRGSFQNLAAYLFLPAGFEPVGGGDNVTAYYTGTVSQGSLVNLQFPIFIAPDVEKGSYTANLHLYYSPYFDQPEDELQIPFEVTGKPIIDAKVLNDSLVEGEQRVLLELSNDGDAIAKNLKIVEITSSSVLAELDVAESLGSLEPGDYATVPLRLFVPSGMKGKILSLAVEVSLLGPRNIVYQVSKTLQMRVEEAEEVEEAEVKFTTKFPDVTVEAGKVVQYPITITNSGDADRLMLLSVEPPTNWKVVFKSGALEVSRIYMVAGGSENLIIEATPPSAANISTYQIPVQIKSENGDIYAEMMLKATIVGSYAVRLEPSTLLTSVTTGDSTTLTAKITNTGYTPVTGVRVSVEAQSGWESSVTPIQVESLRPNEFFTFTLVVKTPGDTVAGDYMITLTGLSDQVRSDPVQVRVTATTPTSWGLIGVGIAVIMVVALLFVFIKFRRR